MKGNFPNLLKEIDIQVQETQRVVNKLDSKRTTPRHIIIKIPKAKDKERILKAARGKEGERQGEKHQCVVVSPVPPTRDLVRNPGMCYDWELNW